MTGKKFNSLYVVKFLERKNNNTYWLCKCDCGNDYISTSRSLVNKGVKSCGCRNGESRIINITGQKFGRLLVIGINGRKHGEALWKCKCDCGNYVDVNGYALRNGITQSCGCLVKDKNIQTSKKYNTYDLSSKYGIGYTSNGHQFKFDKEDYEKIRQYCWIVDTYGYVMSRDCGRTIKLHRIVMNIDDPKIFVDHIYHDKLDNRKSQLRLVNCQKNSMNRLPTNSIGITGVTFDKRTKKWLSQITYKYKNIYLGRYDNVEEAINIRKLAEEKYFGEYAYCGGDTN